MTDTREDWPKRQRCDESTWCSCRSLPMGVELKPCPFCGGTDLHLLHESWRGKRFANFTYRITCISHLCDATGPGAWKLSSARLVNLGYLRKLVPGMIRRAISLWNDRPKTESC